jgi:hypothetical protein
MTMLIAIAINKRVRVGIKLLLKMGAAITMPAIRKNGHNKFPSRVVISAVEISMLINQ